MVCDDPEAHSSAEEAHNLRAEAGNCYLQVAGKRGGKSEGIQDRVVERRPEAGQVLAAVKDQVSLMEERFVVLVALVPTAGLPV